MAEKDQNSKQELKPDLFGNKPNKRSHDGVKEIFYDTKNVPIPHFLPDTVETRESWCSTIKAFLGLIRDWPD